MNSLGKCCKIYIEPKTIKSWEELARDIEAARKFAMDNNCWVISAKQISSNSLLKVKCYVKS